MIDQEVEEKDGSVDLHIPPGRRLGDLVLRFQKVNFSYGDNQVLKDVSFDLQPGDILGIVGPNGTGKTTVLKLITGRATSRIREPSRSARRSSCATSTRSASLSIRTTPCGRRSPAATSS